MKNLVLSLFFLLAITATAQENKNDRSKIGLKGGYNLSSVSFDGESETDQRHSFHIGFYGESFISEYISIQPELLYSQQGYELRDSSGTFTQKLNYINLPVMLKVYPTNYLFLETGPQVGLAITNKEEFDSNFNLFDTSQEFNPNNFDWGFNFGIGFKTNTGVSLGVRYHLGLGDIYDEGKPKNRVLQFSIGFDF